MNKELLPEELAIMEDIAKLHNKFVALERTHPNELHNWVDAIHVLQSLIAMRIVRREYSEVLMSLLETSIGENIDLEAYKAIVRLEQKDKDKLTELMKKL